MGKKYYAYKCKRCRGQTHTDNKKFYEEHFCKTCREPRTPWSVCEIHPEQINNVLSNMGYTGAVRQLIDYDEIMNELCVIVTDCINKHIKLEPVIERVLKRQVGNMKEKGVICERFTSPKRPL